MKKLTLLFVTTIALFFFLSTAHGRLLYGLVDSTPQRLIKFDTYNFETLSGGVNIHGLLDDSERLFGIDFRPSNGFLYGVSNSSSVYLLNVVSGEATFVSNLTCNFTGTDNLAMDFNPTDDSLVIISNTGEEWQIPDINSGNCNLTVPQLSDITNATRVPQIGGFVFVNNITYVIDTDTDHLGTLSENGTFSPVGYMQLNNPVGNAPIDSFYCALCTQPIILFAVITLENQTSPELYYIDLTDFPGKAYEFGAIGRNLSVISISFPPDIYSHELYTLDSNGTTLNRYLVETPASSLVSWNISGLESGDSLVGISFLPNGTLYGVGSGNNLYQLNPLNGNATLLFVLSNCTLSGNAFGVAATASADNVTLAVISDEGQAWLISANTGSCEAQNVSLELTNSSSNSSTSTSAIGAIGVTQDGNSTVYAIDYQNDILVTLLGMNANVTEVGPLGVDTDSNVGLAIFNDDFNGVVNLAYAILTVGGVSESWQVNLTSGNASNPWPIGFNSTNTTFHSLAASPEDFPYIQFSGIAVVIDDNNTLYQFDLESLFISSNISITGLNDNETLLSIDARPSDQQIYAVSDQNRIYTLDPTSGQATFVVALGCNFTSQGLAMDFSPVDEWLHIIVASTNESYIVSVDNGSCVSQPFPVYGFNDIEATVPSEIADIAFSSNNALYAIDSGALELELIDNVNDTRSSSSNDTSNNFLHSIGSLLLSFNISQFLGFDIANDTYGNQYGFAAISSISGNGSFFYYINLDSGKAIPLGVFENLNNATLRACTVIPNQVSSNTSESSSSSGTALSSDTSTVVDTASSSSDTSTVVDTASSSSDTSSSSITTSTDTSGSVVTEDTSSSTVAPTGFTLSDESDTSVTFGSI